MKRESTRQAENKKEKVNKKQFLQTTAIQYAVPLSELTDYYNILINGILDVVESGKELSLTGFGVYSIKKHKGHPVQFESRKTNVPDYPVFKFAASDVLNQKIREDFAAGKARYESNKR